MWVCIVSAIVFAFGLFGMIAGLIGIGVEGIDFGKTKQCPDCGGTGNEPYTGFEPCRYSCKRCNGSAKIFPVRNSFQDIIIGITFVCGSVLIWKYF